MKQLTKYSKMIVCMVLTLILCVGATLGITLTFFGDTKSGSATITLGSSIYFAESGGVGVAVQNGETPIVPSQSVNIQTTLKVMSGSDTNVTKGVLKVIPSLSDAIEGASLTLTANSTYDVFFGTSTTASTDAEMVVHDNALYLVKQSNNSELYEITPSTSGLVIKFSVPVTFSSNISNDMGGKSCAIEMKGIVLQSIIVDNDGDNVSQTITAFEPYFAQIAGGTTPSGGNVYTTETVGEKEYIIFGSYPQTIKASSVSITSDPVDSNSYYTGSDGAKYAKVTATMYGTGTEYNASDGTTMTTGTDYYFKVEPLKWRVLSNDGTTALIVCDQVITAMAYQSNYVVSGDYYAKDSSGNILTDNGNQVYANNYKWSALRTFLTGDFYNKAFTTSEKAIIQTTTVDNSAASTGVTSNSYTCENTEDKVFALSYQDMLNTAYGFTNSTSMDSNRIWKGSDYAKANYLWVDGSNTNSSFLLRSPNDDGSSFAWYVFRDGRIDFNLVYFTDYGVVPALQLSL